jgi:hypothetical protein
MMKLSGFYENILNKQSIKMLLNKNFIWKEENFLSRLG